MTKADELDRAADLLDSALMAPSLKARTLRQEAERLRDLPPSERSIGGTYGSFEDQA